MRRLAIAAALLGSVGCNDLATPADLARPQILAVRADPPAVVAGERARLSVVLAGPDGFITPAVTRWDLQEPRIGALELEGDGSVFVRAPDALDDIALALVEVTAELDDGSELVALKGVALGVDDGGANPTITDVRIDGASVDDGGAAEVTGGDTVELDADADPAPGQFHEFAWYATTGEIDRFRLRTTEMVTDDEDTDGLIILVYRDGLGGVAWRSATLTVR